jgi:uncharacterized cupredoxin-like copper-binding protein
MRRRSALLLLALPLLSGCGGGPSYVHKPDGVLEITLDEYRLRPANFQVPAGRVQLRIRNVGRLTHNVVIQQFETDPGEEPKVYGRTDTVHPGQTATERGRIVLKPGKYRLVCSVGQHASLGQWGELKVVPRRSGD